MGKEYSVQELMVVVLSRELKDGEAGMVGAYSEIPQAAIRLAQLTHAPNLTWYCGAAGFYNKKGPIYRSLGDYRNILGAEAVSDLNDVLNLVMTGKFDFFFVGGLQIDKHGNINLVCVGDYKKPKLRGPGTVGLATTATHIKRSYVYLTRHDTRTFVEKVDFISAPGPAGCEKAGFLGKGPSLIVTPLAVMDFEPQTKQMKLKSLHPGVTVEDVVKNTGFELMIPEKVEETKPPTREELQILRTKVDPFGLLR